MSILSIQSHVSYGYVGNKAATYPLQAMGYDVWPVNTVQFSNHTGYSEWKGEISSREQLRNVIRGIEALGVADQCQAILSGYMGSEDICSEVQDTAHRFKARNKDLIYLCDPVIDCANGFIKPEILAFFKTNLSADIITPNQIEAEILSGIKINVLADLELVAKKIHDLGIKILVITGITFNEDTDHLYIFVSNGVKSYVSKVKNYIFSFPLSGTGDLFSALYLGNYLASKDCLSALQKTIVCMDKVVRNTFISGQRELKILSIDYNA